MTKEETWDSVADNFRSMVEAAYERGRIAGIKETMAQVQKTLGSSTVPRAAAPSGKANG